MAGFLPPDGGHLSWTRLPQSVPENTTHSRCASPITPRQIRRARWKRRLVRALCLALSVSCAPRYRTAGSETAAPRQIAPEVTLAARGQPPLLGKIVDLDGDQVTFLPSPYWEVESRTLAVDDISTIRVKARGRSGRAFLYGFAGTFVALGLMAGSDAQYKDDYGASLSAAALGGLLGGIVGAIVGAIASTETYHFQGMSAERKRSVLHTLMGQ